LYAFRGHCVGDDAAWVAVNWYMPFAVTLNGVALDLTNFAVTSAVAHAYAGGPTAFPITATIDTPKTAGTGVITILGTDTAAVAPGTFVYEIVLTPSSPSVTNQPVVIYGDLELRAR
jgi:hypothetical protein